MEVFVGSVFFPIFDDTHNYESQFHIFFFFTELLYYRGLWGHLGLPKFRVILKYPDICD